MWCPYSLLCLESSRVPELFDRVGKHISLLSCYSLWFNIYTFGLTRRACSFISQEIEVNNVSMYWIMLSCVHHLSNSTSLIDRFCLHSKKRCRHIQLWILFSWMHYLCSKCLLGNLWSQWFVLDERSWNKVTLINDCKKFQHVLANNS